MSYQITYSFSSSDEYIGVDDALSTDEASEAMPVIEKMSSEEDIVYIYNTESGEQLEVSLCGDKYLVRDFLQNGFYKKKCRKSELLEVLYSLSSLPRNPELLGMEPFE